MMLATNLTNLNETNQNIVMGFSLLSEKISNTNTLISKNCDLCVGNNEMIEHIMEMMVTIERKISFIEQMMKDKNEIVKDITNDDENYKMMENINETCCSIKDKVIKNNEMLEENNEKKKKKEKNKSNQNINNENY